MVLFQGLMRGLGDWQGQQGCLPNSGVLPPVHSVDLRAPQVGGMCGLLAIGS